jgi:hypothetical protein
VPTIRNREGSRCAITAPGQRHNQGESEGSQRPKPLHGTLDVRTITKVPPEQPCDDGGTCGHWNRLRGSDLLVQKTTLWQVENDLSGTVLERRIVRRATLSLAAAPGVGQ